MRRESAEWEARFDDPLYYEFAIQKRRMNLIKLILIFSGLSLTSAQQYQPIPRPRPKSPNRKNKTEGNEIQKTENFRKFF